ncbi:hypothetical protein E2C01_075007 [Portunus trituberculatus]|uniref:Uncharacterized protein n=1 Tax=Portunus trituberculatus TaxID=210409 RepID=A0A5B7IFS1_PORTR|nr:hypothetical protein [Portunus trituberculatus]
MKRNVPLVSFCNTSLIFLPTAYNFISLVQFSVFITSFLPQNPGFDFSSATLKKGYDKVPNSLLQKWEERQTLEKQEEEQKKEQKEESQPHLVRVVVIVGDNDDDDDGGGGGGGEANQNQYSSICTSLNVQNSEANPSTQ